MFTNYNHADKMEVEPTWNTNAGDAGFLIYYETYADYTKLMQLQ